MRGAVRADPRNYRALQDLVTALAEAARRGHALFAGEGAQPAGEPEPEPVSVIVCSVDPARLAAMQENFRSALADTGHEFVVIRDARSLAEGYARGLLQARHDLVVFAHDDIEIVSPRPFHALQRALRDHDVVGLAGSRLARGPAVTWAGHPHIHGWVSYPAPADQRGFDAAPFSLECGILGGMQALDGLLLAARRSSAERVGFDAATFDGFHFYDLDFTVRAHRAGLRLAVTTEVLAIHASAGSYDDAWRGHAARFLAKFPELSGPKGDHHAYGARLPDRPALTRFFAELRGIARAP